MNIFTSGFDELFRLSNLLTLNGSSGIISMGWDLNFYALELFRCVLTRWFSPSWSNTVVCVTKVSERVGTGGTAVLQGRLASASSSDLSLNPSSILLSLHRSSSAVSHLSPVPQPIRCVTLFEVGHQRPWKHCLILHCSFIHPFLFHYAFLCTFVEPTLQTQNLWSRMPTHTYTPTHSHTHRPPHSSGKATGVQILILYLIFDIFSFNC